MATAPASTSSSPLECPVCHETFDEPKMLPCTHLVCTKCILSWLAKAGATAGCPLCRAPVLSPSRQGHRDLEAEVKRLPTDLVTVAVVDSQRVLAAPHVCDMCPNNVAAESYCFQCAVKLCKACTSHYHKKLPSTKDHALEDLHKLTQSRLIASQRVTCKSHPDRPAELYCPAHREVICILCGTTGHGNCSDKKTIEDVATEKRTELKQEAESLRDMEAVINTQINEAKDKLKAMRRRAKDTFDDLEQWVKKRRDEVNQLIQAEEDVTVTSLAELEKWRAALALNASSMNNLLDSASSSALLAMASDLVSRLSELKSQSGTVDRVEVADLTLDDHKLNQLKAHIASLGQVVKVVRTTVTSPLASAPTAPGLSTSIFGTTPRIASPAAPGLSTSIFGTTPRIASPAAPGLSTPIFGTTPRISSPAAPGLSTSIFGTTPRISSPAAPGLSTPIFGTTPRNASPAAPGLSTPIFGTTPRIASPAAPGLSTPIFGTTPRIASPAAPGLSTSIFGTTPRIASPAAPGLSTPIFGTTPRNASPAAPGLSTPIFGTTPRIASPAAPGLSTPIFGTTPRIASPAAPGLSTSIFGTTPRIASPAAPGLSTPIFGTTPRIASPAAPGLSTSIFGTTPRIASSAAPGLSASIFGTTPRNASPAAPGLSTPIFGTTPRIESPAAPGLSTPIFGTTPRNASPAAPGLSTSTSVTTPRNADKPRRAELAKVLRVGDRVRRGPDWPSHFKLGGGRPGTVTAIPSQIAAARGRDPTGRVDVRWDTGHHGTYRMGFESKYELDLV